ncbi:uncharacterized protein LOC117108473 isoform X2 [Anneissia japonica]|uniref:uncharacterized protein LOC117108473 isoform X2 n=1 Tax=Anneissia japonica TaxID=1529436 RepID=UPI0014257191|nr:uncharacterized protein LOC117108473 isoform X2 [Anneissia japonica]
MAADCCRRLRWYELYSYSTTFRDDIELSREDLLRTSSELKSSSGDESVCDLQHSGTDHIYCDSDDISVGVSSILDDEDCVICGGISGDELLAEFGMGRLCASPILKAASCTDNDLDEIDYDEVFSYDFYEAPAYGSSKLATQQSSATKYQTIQKVSAYLKSLVLRNRPN